MKKIPIIIDCDPGHDDAIAILWALSNERLDVRAITTVAGNQTIEKVTGNALKILTKANRLDIPVARGAKEPIVRKLVVGGALVHGDSGLEGPVLPEPKIKESDLRANELLIKTLEEAEEAITIVAIGPLTNIAVLLVSRPDLKEKIKEFYIMGGGIHFGNWTPAAEYNIFADPEAAKIVFNCGIHITMAGLDVTQRAYVTREENEVLRNIGTEMTDFVAQLIDYFSKFHYEVEELPGCTIHDATAICALLYPELFTSITCNVDVETQGELTLGATIADTVGYKEKLFGIKADKNTTVLLDVDRLKYNEYMFRDLSKL
ncbi:nucleoside hydrolase [Peptoniphilaceae bacterium SGI.131]